MLLGALSDVSEVNNARTRGASDKSSECYEVTLHCTGALGSALSDVSECYEVTTHDRQHNVPLLLTVCDQNHLFSIAVVTLY